MTYLNISSSMGSPFSPQGADLTRFTTWGNGFSVGRIVGEVSSLPGKALEVIGASCRKVEWLPINETGAVVENIGSVIRGIGCLTGSIVTLLERLSLNIAKTLGGIGIATIGIFAAPFNTSVFDTGVASIKDAWAMRQNNQRDLALNSPERTRAINQCRDHVHITLKEYISTFDILTCIPDTWRQAYQRSESNCYVGEIKNIFPVRVSFHWEIHGDVHIMFGGAGSLKAFSSAITSMLGIEDETLRNARKLVQDFATKNPGKKIHVSGFSFGGALAQYAGISAGVPVTCFNSLALSPALIDKMVDWDRANLDKIKNAKVEHFNAKDDWMAQGLQSSYSLKWLNLNQLGTRFIVPEAYSRDITSSHRHRYVMENDSHNAPHMLAALKNTMRA